ncbi:hypothetical protein OMP43_19700 [Sphingomonas sp. CBMAI 2297]|uniref:hypothetical protein n=1 Tax=Sphingomonas sp. CBMAI 2297 TaxID=2991720 RepID=UPI00245893E9|nr:hypothetical protein [Sphingomonas sp. CBMAI 2297]MDH4746256.1 hypothetical protein [Sphingomonas sp. CBMAI 2297]
MNKDMAINMIRNGQGDIWSIINYCVTSHEEAGLADHIDDDELRSSILYILSELPSIYAGVHERIIQKIKDNEFRDSDLEWANEIINTRIR